MHFFEKIVQREAQAHAKEQEDILKIMTVFPAYYKYKSHPTYEQFKPFCDEACQQGYSLTTLYHTFASGRIPSDLDALIRKHAEHWRPAGEIVESGMEMKDEQKETPE